MRYRVELDELLAFVDRLQSFEQRAEAIAARVDGQVASLHDAWTGARRRRIGHSTTSGLPVQLKCEERPRHSARPRITRISTTPMLRG